jgi:hypothetical protein
VALLRRRAAAGAPEACALLLLLLLLLLLQLCDVPAAWVDGAAPLRRGQGGGKLGNRGARQALRSP